MNLLYDTNICRICISKTDESCFTSVFDVDIEFKLKECLNLQLTQEDSFPKKICTLCITKLNDSYNFRKLCFDTQNILKQLKEAAQLKGPVADAEINEKSEEIEQQFIKCPDLQEEISDYDDPGETFEPGYDSINEIDDEFENNISQEKCGRKCKSRKKLDPCEICGKYFRNIRAYNLHKRRHSREKQIEVKHGGQTNECDICKKVFTHSSVFEAHKRIHTGERPFVCEECGKTYKYAHNLQIHSRVHTGDRPYKCHQCSKCFTSNSTLKAHQLTHTGDKRFICNICGKRVSRSGDLTVHKRIHTDERPYGCTLCSKRFRMSSHLKVHMASHTGEKNFTCDICNKKFAESRQLDQHYDKHNGIKRYQCENCVQSFYYSSSLIKHRKKHDLGKTEEGLVPNIA